MCAHSLVSRPRRHSACGMEPACRRWRPAHHALRRLVPHGNRRLCDTIQNVNEGDYITSLTQGATYDVRLRAFNALGVGLWSMASQATVATAEVIVGLDLNLRYDWAEPDVPADLLMTRKVPERGMDQRRPVRCGCAIRHSRERRRHHGRQRAHGPRRAPVRRAADSDCRRTPCAAGPAVRGLAAGAGRRAPRLGEARMTLDLNEASAPKIRATLRLPQLRRDEERSHVERVVVREPNCGSGPQVRTGRLRKEPPGKRSTARRGSRTRGAGGGGFTITIQYIAPYAIYPYAYHRKRGNDWIRKSIVAAKRRLERGAVGTRGSRTAGAGRGGRVR